MKKALSKALFSEIKKHLDRSKALQPREFAQFRRLFTTAKSERSSGYMNVDKYLSAYMSFYFPVHLPETYWILEQNKERLNLNERSFKSLLDIGAGPGTASLSVLLWLLNNNIELPTDIKLMDQSKKALVLASQLMSTLGVNRPSLYRAPINKRSLNDFGGQEFDLVVVSHFLNELGSGPAKRYLKEEFVEGLQSLLTPNGLVILVEPPLREPTMDLMRLRDEIQQEGLLGEWRVLAPCPTLTGLCPLMKEKKGWCYSQPKRENMPAFLTQLDSEVSRMADIRLTHPGFSYLVIGNPKIYLPSDVKARNASTHKILNSDRNAPFSILCAGEKLEKEYRVRKEQRGAYIYNSDKKPLKKTDN